MARRRGGGGGGLAALVVVAAAMSTTGVARAAGPAVVGGRIVFRDGARELRAQDVERLRWGHIAVELRRGWQVFSVRPDENGVFVVTGPPGTYHFEYLRLGELAEFFPPHEVEAVAGRITCIGTLEVIVNDLNSDLGQNTSSTLSVRNNCRELGPSLQQAAAGRPATPPPSQPTPAPSSGGLTSAAMTTSDAGAPTAPTAPTAQLPVTTAVARPTPPASFRPSPMDFLVGLRAEIAADTDHFDELRGNLVVPLTLDKGKGNVIGGLSVVRVAASDVDERWPVMYGAAPTKGTGWGGAVSAGYSIWAFEFQGFAGYLSGLDRGIKGPSLGGSLRFGSVVYGLGARFETYPSTGNSLAMFMIDLSPFGLLGALL